MGQNLSGNCWFVRGWNFTSPVRKALRSRHSDVPSRLVSISIPLDGDATDLVNLAGKISTPDGRVVATFEDSLEAGGIYQRHFPLVPGSYRLNVIVKSVATGAISTQEQNFEVK